MDPILLSNVAAWSLQVLSVVLLAATLSALIRIDAAGVRYAQWRLTLLACFLLPWLQRREPEIASNAPAATSTAVVGIASVVEQAASPAASGIDWAAVLMAIVFAGIFARAIWLGVGVWRLRRLRLSGALASPEHGALQQTLRTRAEIRYIEDLGQPVTFGWRRPVVLLPVVLQSQSADIRDAVLMHELLHVRRRDWIWVLVEEVVRALFWWHPAIWWLVSKVQLAREEVVDADVVAITGRRRTYVEALLTFADAMPLTAAAAFSRRRHFFRRLVLIAKEDVMTSRRIVASAIAMLGVMAIGGWYAVGAFPLLESGGGQLLQKQPGPLEQVATPASKDNPAPRRIHHERATYPAEAASVNAWVSVTLKLTVDASGSVAEARVTRFTLKTDEMSFSFTNAAGSDLDRVLGTATVRARPGEPAETIGVRYKAVIDAVVEAAVVAVGRWRYEPPVNAPVSFEATFYFSPGPPVTDTQASPEGVFENALRIGGNAGPPKKLRDVRPVYPADARDARVQGVVIIDVRIDETGRVSDARVLRSIPMLDQAALEAVRQWEFTPTLLNGVPTPIVMTVTVNFTLQ